MGEIRITDDEFLTILRDCTGHFSRTAKAISEKYGIDYSRQAARQRALEHGEILTEIIESRADKAEQVHDDLLDDPDPRIRKDVSQFILKTLAKKRGYVERVENAVTDNDGNNIQPIININVIRTKKEIDDSL